MVALRKENIKLKGRIFELEKEQRELVEGAMLIKTNGVRHRRFKIIDSFFGEPWAKSTYEQKLKMTKKLATDRINSIEHQKDLQFDKLYCLIYR